jgi:hypothetical protein
MVGRTGTDVAMVHFNRRSASTGASTTPPSPSADHAGEMLVDEK